MDKRSGGGKNSKKYTKFHPKGQEKKYSNFTMKASNNEKIGTHNNKVFDKYLKDQTSFDMIISNITNGVSQFDPDLDRLLSQNPNINEKNFAGYRNPFIDAILKIKNPKVKMVLLTLVSLNLIPNVNSQNTSSTNTSTTNTSLVNTTNFSNIYKSVHVYPNSTLGSVATMNGIKEISSKDLLNTTKRDEHIDYLKEIMPGISKINGVNITQKNITEKDLLNNTKVLSLSNIAADFKVLDNSTVSIYVEEDPITKGDVTNHAKNELHDCFKTMGNITNGGIQVAPGKNNETSVYNLNFTGDTYYSGQWNGKDISLGSTFPKANPVIQMNMLYHELMHSFGFEHPNDPQSLNIAASDLLDVLYMTKSPWNTNAKSEKDDHCDRLSPNTILSYCYAVSIVRGYPNLHGTLPNIIASITELKKTDPTLANEMEKDLKPYFEILKHITPYDVSVIQRIFAINLDSDEFKAKVGIPMKNLLEKYQEKLLFEFDKVSGDFKNIGLNKTISNDMFSEAIDRIYGPDNTNTIIGASVGAGAGVIALLIAGYCIHKKCKEPEIDGENLEDRKKNEWTAVVKTESKGNKGNVNNMI